MERRVASLASLSRIVSLPWIVVALATAVAVSLPAAALTPPPPKARPVGPELEVSEPGDRRLWHPALAAFADGGFAVAWLDREDRTVRLRVFDHHNRASTPELVVGESRLTRGAIGVDLAVLGDGTLIVVWEDGTCPLQAVEFSQCVGRVLGRLFSPSGTPLGEAFAISEEVGAYSRAEVAALIDATAPRATQRGFVVVWTVDHETSSCSLEEIEHGCNFSDVLGRVWPSGGEPEGPSFRVNEIAFDEQNVGGVAGTADGGFVAVWESWQGEGLFLDVVRRRFDAAGDPLEGDVQVNADETAWGWQQAPDVAVLSGGGHVVVWSDSAYDAVGLTDEGIVGDPVLVRVYRADGEPAGEEFLAGGGIAFGQGSPAVAAGGRGDFVVAWECPGADCPPGPEGGDGSRTVFASYFSEAYLFGEILFDQPLALDTQDHQLWPMVASDGGEGWVVAWLGQRSTGTVVAPPGELPRTVRARRLGFARPCDGLCLDGRFSVTVSWQDFQGHRGVGHPVVRGDDWGTFWFFHPANVELAVKVLDARTVDGRFWVFAGALSNVEYRLRVTDTATGLEIDWTNPSGTFLSRADTRSLAAAHEVVPASAPAAAGAAAVAPSPARRVASLAAPLTLAPCPAASACLQGGRFELAATWRDFFGNRGSGTVRPLTSDTAWVTFFHPGNPELVVKVLDGRPVNGHFWVFYGSLSNVEFDLTVTDRLTGERRVYANPSGTFASRGDAAAFPAP